jgi:hypothetical protein
MKYLEKMSKKQEKWRKVFIDSKAKIIYYKYEKWR